MSRTDRLGRTKFIRRIMNKLIVSGMLAGALVFGAMSVSASEMDPVVSSSSKEKVMQKVDTIKTSATERPNVIVVAVDTNGKETYYAGSTSVDKDAVEKDKDAAAKAIEEIVTDKNRIKKPSQSKDEMDSANSTPQWFYVGFCGIGIGLGWAPCGYHYVHTYYPPEPVVVYHHPVYYHRPGPPHHWRPHPCYHHHYRFYWA